MLHLLDARHLGRPGIISIAALDLGADAGLALIDCGPDVVFDHLATALREQLGRGPEDVRHLVLSHIHFDHAGGAWRWAREFGTDVHVHPRGAAHLLDPSKLLASATQIYGDRMSRLWGAIEPLPAERLHLAEDNATLRLSDEVALRVLATPGHAQHHNAYFWENESTVFAGDVAGCTIAGGPVVPPCPPPDIHLEAWHASLERLRALAPRHVYITHFGELHEPLRKFDELETRLHQWAGWMRDRLRAGEPEAALLPEFNAFVLEGLRAQGLSESELAAYEQANPAFMSVAGLARYWRKFHPEALA
ncbi:MAG: MBL fold metallo-hydrolase [Verrucomicrobia bacterium]|nr:MBL fold metallo-hydrolase [Verrucomicrobiota bacterium]